MSAERAELARPGTHAHSIPFCVPQQKNVEAAEFSIVVTARYLSGNPTPSSESSEVRWVEPAAVEDCEMDRSMRMRIGDYLHLDHPRLT